MRSRKTILLSAVLVALALSAVASATASASPEWHFGGTTLPEFEGETVVGAAFSSSLKSGGVATTCEHFLYNMEVWNAFGTGEALIDELPLFNCSTTAPNCTVTSIEAENLPWFSYVAKIAGKEYLELEEIDVKITYGGASCGLPKTVKVEGTAGGVINNGTSTATFDKATFEATHTALKIGAETVEWTGEFPMEAFEESREKAVEVF
jgi:hypothetical protein